MFVANDKRWAFNQKLNDGKHIRPSEFNSFPTLKDFSEDTGGDINKSDFLLLCNEKCQIWKTGKIQWTDIFQITYTWYSKFMSGWNDPFSVQDWLMNFNITKHEKFNDTVSDSTLKLVFKKPSLVEFW